MKSGEGLKTKTFIFCKKFESIAYWVSLEDKPIKLITQENLDKKFFENENLYFL